MKGREVFGVTKAVCVSKHSVSDQTTQHCNRHGLNFASTEFHFLGVLLIRLNDEQIVQ